MNRFISALAKDEMIDYNDGENKKGGEHFDHWRQN